MQSAPRPAIGRRRRRVVAALALALGLHVGAREVVTALEVHPRLVARAPAPAPRESTGVVVEVRARPAPPAARAPATPRAPAPRPARDVVEAPPPRDVAAAPGAAEDAPPPSVVRVPEGAVPAAPRSFLERVIAGTAGGPAPRLDGLTPEGLRAPTESASESARRKINAIARAAAAHGAPPTGTASIVEALEPLEGGGYRYDTGGFVATIHEDGNVTFEDRGNKGGLGASGLPGRSGALLEPYAPATLPLALTPVDGSPAPRVAGAPIAVPSTTLASGSFDPTAAALRAMGQDPYEHEKICFLDETADLRVGLRIAHERAQMAGLRRALEDAWFDVVVDGRVRTPEERRASLFAIWDECREEEVGLLARQLVESFVRQHLPRGAPHAFSDEELATLNARRKSSLPFAPYG